MNRPNPAKGKKDPLVEPLRAALRLARKQQNNVVALSQCELAQHAVIQRQTQLEDYPAGDVGVGMAVRDTLIALTHALRPYAGDADPQKIEWYHYLIIWRYYLNPEGIDGFDLIANDLGKVSDHNNVVIGLSPTYVRNFLHGEALQHMANILQMWTDAPSLPAITRASTLPREQSTAGGINTIPPLPDHFLGRETELTTLQKLFFADTNSLSVRHKMVALVALGGMGKTTVAHAFAQHHRARFPDGCISIDLQGSTDRPLTPEEILQRILVVLGVNTGGRTARHELVDSYRNYLTTHRILVIANDAGTEDQIRDLVPLDGSALLITSRTYIPLPELEWIELRPLTSEHAATFLRTKLPKLGDYASRLATLCSNIPLALVLASGFLKNHKDWEITEYLDELEQHPMQALQLGNYSVYAVLATTLKHLATADVQAAWAWHTLAVFPTAFDKAAATALWVQDLRTTRRLLGQLQNYSLIDYDQSAKVYTQHDLLRAFALTSIQSTDASAALAGAPPLEEWDTVQTRHALHYGSQTRSLNKQYHQTIKDGQDIIHVLRRFDAVWPHLNAAWKWMLQQESVEAREFVSFFPSDLVYFLMVRLSPRERLEYEEYALAAARARNDLRTVSVYLSNMGVAWIYLGEYERGIACAEQAIALDREPGRSGFLSTDYGVIGLGYLNRADSARGDLDNAITALNQSLELVEETDAEGRIIGQSNLAEAYLKKGDATTAYRLASEALDACRASNELRPKAFILSILGRIAAQDHPEQGVALLLEALSLDKEFGDEYSEAEHAWYLGEVYEAIGDYATAIVYMQVCVEYEQRIGHLNSEKHAQHVEELHKRLQNPGEGRG